MCAPPEIVPVGPWWVDFLTRVLLWFCLELPRKGSAKGSGIRDARVEVRPVNLLTTEAQDDDDKSSQVKY
jgi:hypothetical protein